jgi:hypothetical protein
MLIQEEFLWHDSTKRSEVRKQADHKHTSIISLIIGICNLSVHAGSQQQSSGPLPAC